MLSMSVHLCFCRLTSPFQSEMSLPFQTLHLPALVEDPEECLQKGPGAGLQVKLPLSILEALGGGPSTLPPADPSPVTAGMKYCRPGLTADAGWRDPEGSRHRVGILGAVAPWLGGGTTGPEPQGELAREVRPVLVG